MRITLKNVRLAFPRLFEAQSGPDGGDPKYSATFILTDDATRQQLDEAVEAAAQEKWGAKSTDALKKLKAQGKVCHKDGEQKADYDGFEGNTFVSASNKVAPAVFDKDGTRLQKRDGRPYAGCYVDVSLDVWAQDNKFGRRINAALRGVKFRSDGEPFAGSGAATEDEFEFEASDDDAADDLT